MIAAERENPWVEYWNSQNVWASPTLWRKQMETFVRLSSRAMNFCQDDKVHYFAHLDFVVAFVRGMQQMCVSGAKMIIGDTGN